MPRIPIETAGLADRDEEWMLEAACRGMHPDIFFPPDGNDIAARRTCAGCVVRFECRTAAKANGERYGVWGGEFLEVSYSGGGGGTLPGCKVCGKPVTGGLVMGRDRYCSAKHAAEDHRISA